MSTGVSFRDWLSDPAAMLTAARILEEAERRAREEVGR